MQLSIFARFVTLVLVLGLLSRLGLAQEQPKPTLEQQIAVLTEQLQAEKQSHQRDVALIRFQLSQCQVRVSYTELQLLGCSVDQKGVIFCSPSSVNKPTAP